MIVKLPVAPIVEGDMLSLNVATTAELTGTPVAAGVEVTGDVEITTGRVVSAVVPVVNVHT